jgi:hypothetical protein
VLHRLLSRETLVRPDQAQRILDAARGAAEQFILFFEEIGDYYGGERASVPCRKITMATAG